MSSMLRRPPAKHVHLAPQEGPLAQRVSGHTGGAMFNADKAYGGAHAGALDLRSVGQSFLYTWLDLLQINPVREQPKLISYSAAGPLIRWGHRRIVRTFMAASPRFQGRWAYVGFMQRHYAERPRLTGVPTRLGTTYAYPRFTVAPRTIRLGPS